MFLFCWFRSCINGKQEETERQIRSSEQRGTGNEEHSNSILTCSLGVLNSTAEAAEELGDRLRCSLHPRLPNQAWFSGHQRPSKPRLCYQCAASGLFPKGCKTAATLLMIQEPQTSESQPGFAASCHTHPIQQQLLFS